ncbi:glycoprotein-N-acetylgalactosamine 3-beta-galactosyltransferase 1-like isoform X3 [Homarus americanus]|uniref:glycoprotein-N-acetylgalactosamine 3-beta-galactosyltransferase 1-like isoform X3 n=1 Tax=Homarus americanus TaxID=6706 RepID=UPI001C4590B4|nr:glycoprotein-N-acetylgalactosamine 3-beta-galactosyltransferase 1-like isoform X3 [Homarus americanus]
MGFLIRRVTMGISRSFILTLGTGMFCGFFSFYLLNSTVSVHPRYIEGISPPQSIESHAHNHDELESAAGPMDNVAMHSSHEAHHAGEAVEAEILKDKVRVLCWVMTNPTNHQKKARHIKATWARRCNKLVFMSSEEDKELGAVALEVGEGRDHLWEKTKAAFIYIYNNHFEDADWFMKADDDTYVIVENLRYMLSPYDASHPIWFGCRFKKYVRQGYMSGGAGYVLSREALRKFVEEAIPNPKKCRPDHAGAEDVEIGKCMQNVGVKAVDSRDSLGRGRFFPFVPEHHLVPGHIGPKNWYWDWIYYPSKVGLDCCSDTAVSFHYVPPNKMYELEYFLYHLRPYGINHQDPFPPPLPPDTKSIPQKVIEQYKKDSVYTIQHSDDNTKQSRQENQGSEAKRQQTSKDGNTADVSLRRKDDKSKVVS